MGFWPDSSAVRRIMRSRFSMYNSGLVLSAVTSADPYQPMACASAGDTPARLEASVHSFSKPAYSEPEGAASQNPGRCLASRKVISPLSSISRGLYELRMLPFSSFSTNLDVSQRGSPWVMTGPRTALTSTVTGLRLPCKLR